MRMARSARGVGRGGRAQQLALELATRFGRSDRDWSFLAAGSDGIDGDSVAAGAIVDAGTREAAARLNLDLEAALLGYDSERVFAELKTQVVTGPTGNNLQDLTLLSLK